MLFSALVMRYVSEKSTSNKCEKAVVFSAYDIIFIIFVYPSTSTLKKPIKDVSSLIFVHKYPLALACS